MFIWVGSDNLIRACYLAGVWAKDGEADIRAIYVAELLSGHCLLGKGRGGRDNSQLRDADA